MNLSEIQDRAKQAIEAIQNDSSFGKANIDARQAEAFELINALAGNLPPATNMGAVSETTTDEPTTNRKPKQPKESTE